MIPLSTFFELLITALSIAIFALVYASIIVAPGEIFDWYKKAVRFILLQKTTYIENCSKWAECELIPDESQVIVLPLRYRLFGRFTFTTYLELKDYRKIYNMVLGCEKCVSGQIALWTYLIYCAGGYTWSLESFLGTYQFHIHILLIVFSILCGRFISIAYNYIIRKYD